jgi:hypothetical protein
MPNSNARTMWILAALAVIAACVLMVYVFTRPPGMSAAEARALIQAKNVGLGQLENQQVKEGLAAFEGISAKMPGDPLGPRNVAVAQVLALGDEDGLPEEPQVAVARDALARLALSEGQSAAYHWLALRTEWAARDFAAADTHIAALIDLEPQDPAPWYARYRMSRIAGDEAMEAAGVAALDKAFELAPTNAWLVVEWLRSQFSLINEGLDALPTDPAERAAAEEQLATKLAGLSQRLRAARTTAEAFAHEIQVHLRHDVLGILDAAIGAVGEKDWQTASRQMFMASTLLLQPARPDQQAVRRHPLEFVLAAVGDRDHVRRAKGLARSGFAARNAGSRARRGAGRLRSRRPARLVRLDHRKAAGSEPSGRGQTV